MCNHLLIINREVLNSSCFLLEVLHIKKEFLIDTNAFFFLFQTFSSQCKYVLSNGCCNVILCCFLFILFPIHFILQVFRFLFYRFEHYWLQKKKFLKCVYMDHENVIRITVRRLSFFVTILILKYLCLKKSFL